MIKTVISKPLLLLSAFAALVFMTSAAPSVANEVTWLTSYEDAVNQSQSSNKPILVLFTGSDWCGWCKKLEREVLDTREFATLAANQFVFLKLDFPMYERLPAKQKEHNEKLKSKFGIRGFPTVIILDEKQQKVTSTGYKAGGGRKYAEYLLKTVADYGGYKTKQSHAAADMLNADELQDLYQQARELGQDDDLDSIIAAGIRSDNPTFFLKERYRSLVEEGMIHTKKAQDVRQQLLSSDPDNSKGAHRSVAVIEFQRLSEELEVDDSADPVAVCEPLVQYIRSFGQKDRDHLWRLQMTVAQTLLSKERYSDALAYAKASYESAPVTVRPDLASAVSFIEDTLSNHEVER